MHLYIRCSNICRFEYPPHNHSLDSIKQFEVLSGLADYLSSKTRDEVFNLPKHTFFPQAKDDRLEKLYGAFLNSCARYRCHLKVRLQQTYLEASSIENLY